MKQIQNLNEIVELLITKHKFLHKKSGGGYGIVLLRKPDDTRTIIQEMRYFRLFKHELLDERSLLIYNILTGFTKGNREIVSATSTLYLTDLFYVGMYAHGARFMTERGIDFAYVDNSYSVKIELLQAFVDDEDSEVKAYWTDKDRDVDELLETLTFGRKVIQTEKGNRNIGMDRDL